jgi:cation:H+ antiporter
MIVSVGVALVLMAVGTLLLLRGADWFVDGAGDLARLLGISAVVLGALLAGLEPEEMITAAVASGRGAPDLAIGDVLGTNVTIVTMALGLSALIAPIAIGRVARRQALLATLVSVLPVALLIFGYVSRTSGLLLLAVFVAYTVLLFRLDPQALTPLAELEDDDDDNDPGDDDSSAEQGAAGTGSVRWRPIGMTLLGLLAMALGGPALVQGALQLATIAGVGGGVVGLTLVSLGTGAEMIALGVSAARKHKSDVLVGGILGSFAYNLLVTLGLAAVVRPLPVSPAVTHVALPAMIGAHLALLGLVWNSRMGRVAGGLFIAGYIAYLAAVVALR